MPPSNLSTALLLAILISAAVIDMKQHRLPNILTVSAAVLGITFQCWLYGWNGLMNGVAGFFAGLLLFLPFYAIRWMGAGDVKLMAGVGTFLGFPDSALAMALSLGAGSIIAFGIMAVRGGLIEYLSRYGLMLKCLFFTGQFAYVRPHVGETCTASFPFGLAIALGSLTTLGWYGHLNAYLAILKTACCA